MEPQNNPDKDQCWKVIQTRRDAALGRMNPRFRQLYDEHIRRGTALGRCLKQALWDIDYEREPVSFRQFVQDGFYVGRTLGRSLFARLIDDGEEFFAGGWCEGVFTGAIGYGKTTLGTAMMAYDIYRVSCLRDPALAYGMTPGTEICFVNVSVTKRQAEQGFFRRLYSIVAQSTYFTELFPYNPKIKSHLEFPKGLRCYPVAASEQAALGDNVWAACIDEANFWQVVERSRRQVPGEAGIYDQVAAVYNKLHQRLRSRLNLRGKLAGHIVVLSSARYPNDFTERLERQARDDAERGEHYIFFRRYKRWETAPPGKFTSETFRVEVGDYTRRSRVLTGDDTDVNVSNVIDVPVDLRRDFERDPDGCVRDFAGISVLAIRPFIVRREMIQRMFDLGEAAGLRHPFTKFDVTLQQKDPAVERLLPERLHWIERPKLNQHGLEMIRPDGRVEVEKVLFPALYHAHIDLSKTGHATGLVIAHTVGSRKVQRFDASEMKEVEELKPVIRIDLVLRIVPPPNGEIDIPRVRAIFYELSRRYGMQFGKITFDTFGSQESVKTMKDEGFNADIISVDREITAYETLRTAIYDQRIFCYRVPVLERELTQLELGEGRVEHPATAGGSKDLADALAGAVQHCEESWRAAEGSRGLFKFGIVERVGELPEKVQQEIAAVYAKVAGKGEPLNDQDEDKLLLSQFFSELFDDNKSGGA